MVTTWKDTAGKVRLLYLVFPFFDFRPSLSSPTFRLLSGRSLFMIALEGGKELGNEHANRRAVTTGN